MSATAQDASRADLAAMALSGMKADGTVTFGSANPPIAIRQTAPGEFDATSPEMVAHFVVAEKEPCVFEITVSVGGQPSPQALRVDFNRISAITYEPRDDASHGLTGAQLTIDAADGALQQVYADGRIEKATNHQRIQTSMTLDELNAAAAALRSACPGA